MHFSISKEFKIQGQFYIWQLLLLISRWITSSIKLQHAMNYVSVGRDGRLLFEGKFYRMGSKHQRSILNCDARNEDCGKTEERRALHWLP